MCGLTIEKFWSITWRDFSIYMIAWERAELNEWARVRKLAHGIYSSVADKNSWKPEHIWWPLPIDEKEEVDRGEPIPTDPELRKKHFEMIHKRYNKPTDN